MLQHAHRQGSQMRTINPLYIGELAKPKQARGVAAEDLRSLGAR